MSSQHKKPSSDRRTGLIALAVTVAVVLVGIGGYTWHNHQSQPEPSRRIIALTFDDGPHPGYTDQLLDILREKGVPATFFVTGRHAELYPELIKREVAEGHVIGNHSYSHRPFNLLTDDQQFNELLGTQQIIHQITGHSPKFIRVPMGRETPGSQAAVRKLGLVGSVGWAFNKQGTREDDWKCTGADKTLRFMQDATQPGAILLAHDGFEVTACADQLTWLREYIDWARSQSYEFGLLHIDDKPNEQNMYVWARVVPVADAQRWNE
ncbi:MAG: polysaccharide deacetylase family protein [Candidatus Saccharimonadales bacterium]